MRKPSAWVPATAPNAAPGAVVAMDAIADTDGNISANAIPRSIDARIKVRQPVIDQSRRVSTDPIIEPDTVRALARSDFRITDQYLGQRSSQQR